MASGAEFLDVAGLQAGATITEARFTPVGERAEIGSLSGIPGGDIAREFVGIVTITSVEYIPEPRAFTLLALGMMGLEYRTYRTRRNL